MFGEWRKGPAIAMNPIAFRKFQRYQHPVKRQLILPIVSFALISFSFGLSAKADDAKTNAAPSGDLGALFRMHWDNKVRSFKEQNEAWRNVVLLGDSITEGFNISRYFPGRRILNRGIGADIIGNALPTNDHRGVLRRLDNSVFDCAATDVFLMIGINDLGAGRSVEVMEQGYREILQRIKDAAPSIRVHVQSILPTRDKYAKHNEPVREFNQRLRKMASEFGYNYIDLHKLMVDDKGELRPELTPEGLHLSDAAYQIWRQEVLKTLRWN